jgi:hypothetical protein
MMVRLGISLVAALSGYWHLHIMAYLLSTYPAEAMGLVNVCYIDGSLAGVESAPSSK